jgi:hypothetical protein
MMESTFTAGAVRFVAPVNVHVLVHAEPTQVLVAESSWFAPSSATSYSIILTLPTVTASEKVVETVNVVVPPASA